jgi:hypothetical protein
LHRSSINGTNYSLRAGQVTSSRHVRPVLGMAAAGAASLRCLAFGTAPRGHVGPAQGPPAGGGRHGSVW